MKENSLQSEKDYIEQYQKKGYTSSYRIQEYKLVNANSNLDYSPKEVYIVAEHRFEGMSNPSDMSILYVIETKEGSKGTLLANYSPASSTSMAEFFNSIPKENISDKATIQ